MKKILIGIVIILMLLIPSVVSISINKTTQSKNGITRYVGGSGEGNYTKIQDAIDDASDGDTVYVYDGTYFENVVVDVKINLIGENNETTVIDAQKNGTPVKIVSDACLVSGFTILNCEDLINQNWGDAVIKIVGVRDVYIMDNILDAGEVQTSSYNNYGTIDLNGCIECSIINNYVVQNTPDSYTTGIAIHDNSTNNIIAGNDVSHYNFGISITGEGINRDNIISGNYLHHNRFGVAVGNSFNNIIENVIEFNTEVGINIQNTNDNIISYNIVQYNGVGDKFYCGIELMGSTGNNNNFVSDNVIAYNNPCGLQTEYSHGNVITRNNFIDNYGETGNPERWWGNAYFHIQDGFFNRDSFRGNFWSDSFGIFPKIIHGILEVIPHTLTINWINIDWRPAREPYKIPDTTTKQGCGIE